ncbi:MAG TPA: hypothetical protein VJT67_00700 [Longimicrobiaceae bacterium]|nr:hypothetical protein [Longimicrobiaceae bacterium]
MSDYRYSIRVDHARNVMYLAQEGSADGVDLARFRDAYVTALADVKPGFVLVHDQRRVESFTDAALEVGKELVAITNEHRAARVIRIAPEALATRTRVGRVLVAARSKYESVRVNTPEEAEALVEQHLAGAPSV